MTVAGVQVERRTDPWLAVRAASMYIYIDAMWARAEDPRNRTLADLQIITYPPSGDPSEHIGCCISYIHQPCSHHASFCLFKLQHAGSTLSYASTQGLLQAQQNGRCWYLLCLHIQHVAMC